MSDSTNAERPGYTLSERTVGETLIDVFREAEGRIVVAAFASHIHRIQQVVDAAHRFGRKVCVIGRSMVKNVDIASRLGYLRIPDGIMIDVDELDDFPPERIVVISTGSQGEPMAALTRMAMNEHRQVAIERGDTVLISATPIPGNERSIGKTINHLFKLGAKVIYHAVSGVHVSGHASQEELKLMLNLTRPKFFIPIHGEYRMLATHAELGEASGYPRTNIVIPEIGDRIEITPQSIRKGAPVEGGQGDGGRARRGRRGQHRAAGSATALAGRHPHRRRQPRQADGRGRGRSRHHLARLCVHAGVGEPHRRSAWRRRRGASAARAQGSPSGGRSRGRCGTSLQRHLYEKTKRRPVILPIIMEV